MTDASAAPLLDPATLLAHQEFVRAVARRLLGDEHLVEDVVQDTWQAALTAGRRPQLGKLKAWLGTIARNRALRELRTRDQRRKREERAAPTEALRATDEIVAELGASRAIVDAVLSLDEPFRSTVLHHHFGELSVAELARRTETPESTVASRLRKAHELLRARLGGDDPRRHAAFLCGLRAVLEPGAVLQGAPVASAPLAKAALLPKLATGVSEAGWAAALVLFGLATVLAVAFLPSGGDHDEAVAARAPAPLVAPERHAVAAAPDEEQRAEVEPASTPAVVAPAERELERREVAGWREATPAGVLAGVVKRGRTPETRGRVFARRGGSFVTARRPWHLGAPRDASAGTRAEPVLMTTLDDAGRFRFEGLAAGNWAVGYEPSAGAPVFELWTSVDDTEPGRSLVLVLGDASVSGTSYTDDGERRGDALVALSSRSTLGDGFHRFVWTRPDGSYDLGDLAGGPYWWTCEPGGEAMYWNTAGHRTRPIAVRPGEAAREDFGRDRPLPRVAGRLTHVDGAPVAGGGTLLVLPEQGGYAEALLDDDGRFSFRTEPGTYRVQLRHGSGSIWLPTPVVVPDEDTHADWILPGARLSGTLYARGEDGGRQPLANQPVRLVRPDEDEPSGRVEARARTDRSGRFELVGLGAGTWTVTASTMSDASATPGQLIVRSSDVELELDVEVRPASR